MSKLHIKLNIQRFAATLTLSASETSTDVGSNTSTVVITCTIKRSSGSTNWSKPYYRTLTLTCGNQTATHSTELPSSQKTATYTSTFTGVPHNNDGTGSVYYSADLAAAQSLPRLTADGTLTLSTIPRQPNYNSISASSIQETSVRLTASIDTHGLGITAGGWDLSLDAGATWTYYANDPTDKTITGLTPGKRYWYRGYCATAGGDNNSSWGYFDTYEYPHCTVAPDFTIGSNVTLQFYNPLNRQVELQMWSHVSQGFINSTRITATPGHNQNYTFPASSYVNNLYQSIPNITESKYNIDVWYSGNKAVKEGGKYSVNVANCKPTFNLFTWEDINATTLALTGSSSTVVKNKSNIQVTISTANKAVAQNYATITNYEFKCNNVPCSDPMTYSSTESVTGTINGVTSNSFEVRAVDSRGIPSDYVTLVAQDYIQYESLTKGNASISRTNGVSEETTLTFAGKITLVDFGDVDNDLTSVTYQYKKSSDANYTPGETTITPTIDQNGNFTFTGLIEGDEDDGFDVSNVYLVQVIVEDELSTITYDLTLGSGIPHIAYHKNGVGIMGKYNPQAGGLLQIAGVPIQGGGGITGDTVPIGAIMPYSSSYIPENWLECNGQAISRTTYADLFTRIGTTFGQGDGSTTFNVPNFNGRVPVGYGQGTDGNGTSVDFTPLGSTGGEYSHQLSVNELPSHDHMGRTYSKNYNAGVTIPQYRSYARSYYPDSDDLGKWKFSGSGAISGGEINSTVETDRTGSNYKHNNVQPFITTKYIIKAFQSSGVIAEVNNTQNNSTTNTYSCNYINGKTGVELWTNQYPVSDFGTQTIPLSLSGYKVISIFYTRWAGSKTLSTTIYFEDLKTYTELNYSDYDSGTVRSWNRNATIETTGIYFENNTINGSVSNGGLIPYKIIGYK